MSLFLRITLFLALGFLSTSPVNAMNALLDASVKRASMPRQLQMGRSANVTVTVINEGSADWSRLSGSDAPKLRCSCIKGPTGGRKMVEGLTKTGLELRRASHSGTTWTFRYSIQAPDEPGEYTLQWQMYQRGHAFGRPSRPQSIRIFGVSKECAITRSNIKYSPNPVVAGKTFDFTVKVVNTGDVRWGSEWRFNPSLRSKVVKKPSGGNKTPLTKEFKSTGIRASGSRGNEYVFRGKLTAPKTVGAYHIRWQMYDGSTAIPQAEDAILSVKEK